MKIQRRNLKNMKKIALLLAVLMVIALFTACATPTPVVVDTPAAVDPVTPDTDVTPIVMGIYDQLVVNVGPNPDTIDPALNSSVDGATMIIHGFEGLYTLEEGGKPVPGQAQSYDLSADGLTYTFHLRDGLKWSDGKPLTAGDFVYSWNRAINPDTAADYEYMFESIDGYADGKLNVTATDDKTLVVKLVAATPYFMELTAFPTFMPVRQDLVEQYGEAWAVDAKTYVGNGPYMMTEWVPSSHMLYVKNPNYWNVDKLGTPSIKFVLMDDNNAMLAGFEAGELMFIDDVPNNEIETLRSNPGFNVESQLGTYYVSFNVTKKPLDNPLVRKALTLAIDRDFICINIGKAGQIPAGGFVPLGISDANYAGEFRVDGGDYYKPDAASFEANLAEAKAALAEAGYPDGKGFPSMTYLYNTSTGHQAIGEALQNMWSKLGVTVKLESQEWATFLNSRKNGDYEIARNGWLCDYNDPMTMLDMWITGGGNNDAQWSNAEYDAFISGAKKEEDPVKRFKMMHDAEDLMFSTWLLAPIYYYTDIYMINPNMNGFFASPLGYKYFMFATMPLIP